MCLAMAGLAAAGGAAGGGMGLGSILNIGMSVMGSMMEYSGQMQQYNAQMQHRAEQAKQAQETLNQQVYQQQGQYESELNKAQQEKFKVTRKAMGAASRASASAAESGIAGLSVQNLLGEVGFEHGSFMGELNYNTTVNTKKANNELKMAERGATARLASIPIPTKPSFGPTLVNIGSSIVGGLSNRNQNGYTGTPGVTNGSKYRS
jgi:hypothetical protein